MNDMPIGWEGVGQEAVKTERYVLAAGQSFRDLAASILTDDDDTISAAVAEKRCIREPLGCGQSLLKEDGEPKFTGFPDKETAQLYEAEWRITGMCPECQDALEKSAEEAENEDAHNVPPDEPVF